MKIKQFIRLCPFLAILVLLNLTLLIQVTPVKAEDFSHPAFKQQWEITDAPVRNGQVSRSYFWGPQPFAHTKENYLEAPFGLRAVQYFDKARMELTRTENGTDVITNGLLTTELVTGRLQTGANFFLDRQPANLNVAGDALNNPGSPTYATFNQGKLAFGVPGATSAPDRTGQALDETVNRSGEVAKVSRPSQALTYSRYFEQTGHNLANIFERFLLAEPLEAERWLGIVGYPISEPYWAKEKIIVGGQPRQVLIQLFERRVLTYTPTNPPGYQVEMGNIGQHYYTWRYNFDQKLKLPGEQRLILAESRQVLSQSLTATADRIVLAEFSQTIGQLWVFDGGRAVASVGNSAYLIDLTRPRPVLKLPQEGLGLGKTYSRASNVQISGDGRRLSVAYSITRDTDNDPEMASLTQIYDLDIASGDNLKITNTFSIPDRYLFKLSPSGKYASVYFIEKAHEGLLEVDTGKEAVLNPPTQGAINLYSWLGNQDDRFLFARSTNSATTGYKLYLYEAGVGETELAQGLQSYNGLRISPDENFLAITTGLSGTRVGATKEDKLTVNIYSLKNRSLVKVNTWEDSVRGRDVGLFLEDWSTDGTYYHVRSISFILPPSGDSAKPNQIVVDYVISTSNGQVLATESSTVEHLMKNFFELQAPFSILTKRSLEDTTPDGKYRRLVEFSWRNLSDDQTRIVYKEAAYSSTDTLEEARIIFLPDRG